jgi:high-affinity Fe2+/Pb2+ permease
MTNVVGHQVLGSAVPFKSENVYIYIITIINYIIYYTPVMYIYIYYTLDITSNGLTTHPGMHIQAPFMFLTHGNTAGTAVTALHLAPS